MFDVGGGEFLLIIVAIVVLFGPKKIPEMMRTVGKGISYLRRAQSEFERNIHGIKSEVDAVVDPLKSMTSKAASAGKSDNPPVAPKETVAPAEESTLPAEPPETIDTSGIRPEMPEIAETPHHAADAPVSGAADTPDKTPDHTHAQNGSGQAKRQSVSQAGSEKTGAAESEAAGAPDTQAADSRSNGFSAPRPADGIVDRRAGAADEKDLNSQGNAAADSDVNKEKNKERRKSDKQS